MYAANQDSVTAPSLSHGRQCKHWGMKLSMRCQAGRQCRGGTTQGGLCISSSDVTQERGDINIKPTTLSEHLRAAKNSVNNSAVTVLPRTAQYSKQRHAPCMCFATAACAHIAAAASTCARAAGGMHCSCLRSTSAQPLALSVVPGCWPPSVLLNTPFTSLQARRVRPPPPTLGT